MIIPLLLAAYGVVGVYFMPHFARWERAGIETGDQDTMLAVRGSYIRVYRMTNEAKARKSGEFAFWWTLIWPVRFLMIHAATAPLKDNAQAIAAKEAELAIAEHRRIIRNYDAAQFADFDKAMEK